MRILFIAPLPPPIHGQAVASKVFLDAISVTHDVIVVNTAKQKAKSIGYKFWRNFEVAEILFKTFRKRSRTDLIYLTISESILGNIRDLVTYMICFRQLKTMTIHLHGGAGMAQIMKKGSLLARVNGFFLKRLKNVIILGESHSSIFRGIVAQNRIHLVPNFAENYLFAEEAEIAEKFRAKNALNILFLSNLLEGKGYLELLDSYLALDESLKCKLNLNFAGAFGSQKLRNEFFAKIRGKTNISYHGVVKGEQKKKLFKEAHIFCLPTYYSYEGQPISILEAYASGCVVITTNHSGIRDVFKNNKNGYEVEKKSITSIKKVLEALANKQPDLLNIALFNRKTAEERFTTSNYNKALMEIMEIE